MSAFIARAIIKAGQVSEEAGQNKYRAYFVRTHIYEAWRADTETILVTEGYGNLIVAE